MRPIASPFSSGYVGSFASMSRADLAQLNEVAKLLDVPRSTAARYVNHPTFPEPHAELGGRRIWRRADVLAWGKANLVDGRLPQGRPPKA